MLWRWLVEHESSVAKLDLERWNVNEERDVMRAKACANCDLQRNQVNLHVDSLGLVMVLD